MIDNCVQSTKQLLKTLNVAYTSKYLNDTILTHVDYPSLLSISDTLSKYNIETLAIKIDWKKLQDMPLPCIVHVEARGNSLFFILKEVLEDSVAYYNEKNMLIKSAKEEFLSQWTGVCLLTATTEESKEIDIDKKRASKNRLNILIGSIVVLLLSWIVSSYLKSEIVTSASVVLYTLFYTVLKIIGVTVGLFLLWFEVDEYNPTLQSFCTGSSQKINCNAVLNSKYATLFNGVFSVSLISFAYFFGSFVYLLIYGFSPIAFSILGMLSFISLPAVLISIYYQAVVIKQWCKFCIIIQVVLICEIIITFFSGFYKISITYEAVPFLLAVLLVPILGWKLLKPLLEYEKDTNIYKRGLKRIKNNPDVLEGLLLKSKKIKNPADGLGIFFKNDGAKYHIIKVCNPYCKPCAEAHPILEYLEKSSKISLQIMFTAKSIRDHIGMVVGHFFAINEKGDKAKTEQVLNDWYLAEEKDYKAFSSKYPINEELKEQSNKTIVAMRKWCDAEGITRTPTIFINGYELPREYNVKDLKEVLQ